MRGDTGYLSDPARRAGVGRFHVTDLHVQIRRLPKPVVAMVAGYAIGGGHVLHLRLRPDDRRRQRALRPDRPEGRQLRRRLRRRRCCANLVGPKKAKEIWFLCRQYDAAAGARRWGSSTPSCRSTELESETVAWCREMLALSPFALRLLKASFHAAEDGLAGIQQLAHDANLLFYGSEEAQRGPRGLQGRSASPDFSQLPQATLGGR